MGSLFCVRGIPDARQKLSPSRHTMYADQRLQTPRRGAELMRKRGRGGGGGGGRERERERERERDEERERERERERDFSLGF